MIRASVAAARKRTFLLCRYVLILATGALTFREIATGGSLTLAVVWVGTALASNIVMSQVSPFTFFDAGFQAPLLVADTAMISMAFLLTRAGQEMCLFFFFLLIVVAKVENLIMVAICAALIGVSSIVFSSGAPTLMRLPFMFAVGIFFGYVILPERTGEMTRTGGLPSPWPQSGPQLTDPLLPQPSSDGIVRRPPGEALNTGERGVDTMVGQCRPLGSTPPTTLNDVGSGDAVTSALLGADRPPMRAQPRRPR